MPPNKIKERHAKLKTKLIDYRKADIKTEVISNNAGHGEDLLIKEGHISADAPQLVTGPGPSEHIVSGKYPKLKCTQGCGCRSVVEHFWGAPGAGFHPQHHKRKDKDACDHLATNTLAQHSALWSVPYSPGDSWAATAHPLDSTVLPTTSPGEDRQATLTGQLPLGVVTFTPSRVENL